MTKLTITFPLTGETHSVTFEPTSRGWFEDTTDAVKKFPEHIQVRIDDAVNDNDLNSPFELMIDPERFDLDFILTEV